MNLEYQRATLLSCRYHYQMRRIIFIQFDHLNLSYGALKDADPKQDLILFVESARATSDPKWHKTRLYFLISSARHFAADLEAAGFKVLYHYAETVVGGIKEIMQSSEYAGLPVVTCEPSSFRLTKSLSSLGLQFVANDFFLTPRDLFRNWASNQKSYLMETFYRAQRIRLNILIEDGKPTGGAWNFDKENRLPPPKKYEYPPYLIHEPDAIDLKVATEIGITAPTDWATSRPGALRVLENFVTNHFGKFGPYEDAMTTENWALHHSLLSPYLNNGLLHASEVLTAVIAQFEYGDIPIASAEGFIRQLIGWREYVNGMYWVLGDEYRNNNQLAADRKLLPLFTDSGKTKMNCVSNVVSDIETRAWVHHIPRLMVLSNLALITGTNPQEFLDWMQVAFIDAADWVMVPNVIGMGVHADGGTMMTKPYAAGGAYISRMSNYCGTCPYNPKERVGETACPFTTLYWDFLDRHCEEFSSNHRMSQQIFGLKRLKDLPELRLRAQEVLAGLSEGII
jgi:deoxyribodipyrimidine photolyase-related protein